MQRAQWTVQLRTAQINQGFIPVPSAVRAIYPPRGLQEGARTALRAIWFETNTRIWLWLDREQHRLYGPELAEQISWCAAGDRLRVEWEGETLLLRGAGHDEEVARGGAAGR